MNKSNEDLPTTAKNEPEFSDGTEDSEYTNNNEKCKDIKFIRFRHAHHVETRQISWLWQDKIARGKISIIAGDPGLGKSQITASIAAITSTGEKWPDGHKSDIGRIVFLSAEDSIEDTIIPRLIAAGADLSKITFAELLVTTDKNHTKSKYDQIDIAKNLSEIEELITTLKDISLLIIDPITAYIASTQDNNNASIRSALAPLSELATKLDIAVVCVSHNNKNSDQKAIFRIIGSIGFVAAARAAFLVTKDKEDPNTILFLPIKNNISQDKTGLSFQIEPYTTENGIKTSRVKWSDKIINISADEAIHTSTQTENLSPIKEAEDFILRFLSFGSRPSSEILEQAKAEMISEKTLRRAKDNLKIIVGREGFGKGSKPYWKLPPLEANQPTDGQNEHRQPENIMTTYDKNGDL